MPVEFTKVTGESQIIGLWMLEEKEILPKGQIVSSAQAASRGYVKNHSEACRKLLKVMTGWDKVELDKDQVGKPFLKNCKAFISFSHSGNYAAAIFNNQESVGIDIQEIKDKILGIADKFISAREWDYITLENQIKMLHVIWGAKEAMFKKYGKGEVLFKEHIYVHPFELQEKDTITVSFLKKGAEDVATFKYNFYNNYCLVYSSCNL